ncbi:MAG TPA: ribosome silencing factor [Chitinophagales bacterium]
MAKVKTKNDSTALVQLVVNALHEKKGNDVVSLDLRKIKDTVANFFVIAHGDSSTHVNALHQTVVEFTRQMGQPHYRVEGTGNSEWIIVDFVDVVVHIFHRDKRDFYQLEDLWHDAPATRHGEEAAKASAAAKRKVARPEIDVKEYKDKVSIAKLKLKADKEGFKKAAKKGVKSSSKAPAKKSVLRDSIAKPTLKSASKFAGKVSVDSATKAPARKSAEISSTRSTAKSADKKTASKFVSKAPAKNTSTRSVIKSAGKAAPKKTTTKKTK